MSKRISVTINVEVYDRPLTAFREFGFRINASEDESRALIRMMNAAGASAVEFAMGEKGDVNQEAGDE